MIETSAIILIIVFIIIFICTLISFFSSLSINTSISFDKEPNRQHIIDVKNSNIVICVVIALCILVGAFATRRGSRR